MPLQEMKKEFVPDKIGLRTPQFNPAIRDGVQAAVLQRSVEREDKDLQSALSKPAYKPDLRNNPGTDFGLSFDRPEKPQPSVYAAKKNVVDTVEENRPEYTIAEMIVDGLMGKALGVTPYKYGMSQYEKDLQKRKQGVNLELQKAHKAIMPTLLRVADTNSSEYANLEPLQKAMNKNPTLFGEIKNPKKVGVVPEYNPNTGEPNEFAGVPLYSLSYTDPNTGQTEQIKEISVPELLEAYHANLPIPDAVQLERAAARKRVEEKLKKQYKEKGVVETKLIGKLKETGRPMYRFTTNAGETFFSSGEMTDGELARTSFDKIDFTEKGGMTEAQTASHNLAKDKFNTEQNVQIYNLAKENAGTDDMGNQLPVTDRNWADATAIARNGKVIEGKVGTPQEGKYLVRVGDEIFDSHNRKLRIAKKAKQPAAAAPKARVGLRQKTKPKKPATGLTIKKPLKQRKQEPTKKRFGRTKMFDTDKPVIDTKDIAKVSKAIYNAGKKTGDYVGMLERYLLRANKQAGDAIFNQIVKAAKGIAASQSKAKKQSFGN